MTRVASEVAREAPPSGLGGWLLLIMLFLFQNTYGHGRGLYRSFEQLADVGAREVPLVKYAIGGHIVFGLATVLLLVLMFRKSRWFPGAFIVYTLAVGAMGLSWLTLDILLEHIPPGINRFTLRPVAQAVVPAAVWIPYTLKSRRVAATFTK